MRRALVVTVSDRSARGEREDTGGPLLAGLLRELGLEVDGPVVVPDEVPAVQEALRRGAASYDLVVTTGGTGLAPRDVTPEATAPLLDREVPGIAEALRRRSADRVPTSVLSRGLVGTVGRALVVNLPGSPGGVRDGVGGARAGAGARARAAGRRRGPRVISAPGWPVSLAHGDVVVRPLRAAGRGRLVRGAGPQRALAGPVGGAHPGAAAPAAGPSGTARPSSPRCCAVTARRRGPAGCCRSASPSTARSPAR